VILGSPTALFEARTDLLTATLAAMQKPLGVVAILHEQIAGFLTKETIARFYGKRHWELFLAPKSRNTTTTKNFIRRGLHASVR
jgi:hypothetical protein